MSEKIPGSTSPEHPRNKLLTLLDLLGVTFEAQQYQSKTPLPEGYRFEVNPRQLARLAQQPSLRDPTGFNALIRGGARIRYARGSTIHVGVRNTNGQSAGWAGLRYRGENGELFNLQVEEADRRQGLGRALIDERLRLADLAGISSLYIMSLDETNTLESYYPERGFSETDKGEMVLGPNPRHLREPFL